MTDCWTAFREWLTDCEAAGLSTKTLRAYHDRVRRFLMKVRPTTLDDINPAMVAEFLTDLRERGLSAETTYDHFKDLRIWLNWCCKQEMLERNPLNRMRPPKREHKIKPVPSVEELQRLLEAAATDDSWVSKRNRALIATLIGTGMRIGEAPQMLIGDVERGYSIIRGKGGLGRMVPLSMDVRRELRRYIRAIPRPVQRDEPLWLQSDAKSPLSAAGMIELVRRTSQRAGLNYRPHALRRAYASMALAAGMDSEVLSRLLGHTTGRMLRQYAKLEVDALSEAMARYSPLRKLKL
jgi:site-specific recombinase XerD